MRQPADDIIEGTLTSHRARDRIALRARESIRRRVRDALRACDGWKQGWRIAAAGGLALAVLDATSATAAANQAEAGKATARNLPSEKSRPAGAGEATPDRRPAAKPA